MVANLIVFISGNGTNLQAIIDGIENGILQNMEISLVISNRKTAHGLKRAKKAGILTRVELFDKKKMSREEYDHRLKNIVSCFSPSLIVLAGWMHIFSKEFLDCPYTVINIHPALPGKFPGKNAIKQAYDAYKSGMIKETGIMIHEVTEEVDVGKIIGTYNIPIHKHDTLESLTTRVQYYEKPILLKSIINILHKSEGGILKGKVRDIHNIGYNYLLICHSNRLSSFDRNICDIDWKGHVLNKTSTWWFNKTRHIIENHLLYSDEHIMIVKKCTPFRLEVVVRGYITGNTKTSLWTHYKNGERNYCGIDFPDGLIKNQKLECNIVTPTTKGDIDIPISPEEIVEHGFATTNEWEFISNKALELFQYGQNIAAERGFILVDTKYEFGKDTNDNILLIDEIHTCDSSRYWLQNTYKTLFKLGKEPEKLDKDLVRDYVKTKCDPYKDDIPEIPQGHKDTVSKSYITFYETLTSNINEHEQWTYKTLLQVCSDYFKNRLNEFVIIIAGSESDDPFVQRIKNSLREHGIYSVDYALSAHKNTSQVMELLRYYESVDDGSGDNCGDIITPFQKKRIIYVTVAGRSNALSGVVACNTSYPVIACPPFKDKSDMMVNINSTLQMPSKVPVMTILEPGNVALAIKRMFNLKNCRFGEDY